MTQAETIAGTLSKLSEFKTNFAVTRRQIGDELAAKLLFAIPDVILDGQRFPETAGPAVDFLLTLAGEPAVTSGTRGLDNTVPCTAQRILLSANMLFKSSILSLLDPVETMMNLLEFFGQPPGCKIVLRPEYIRRVPFTRNVPRFLLDRFGSYNVGCSFTYVTRPKEERPFFRAMLTWSMGHLLHAKVAPAIADYIEEFTNDCGHTPAGAAYLAMTKIADYKGLGFDEIDPLEAIRRAGIGLLRVKSAQGKITIC
ncbi:MAG: hypothetical protein Q8N81_03665 [bacterium]|nr:hypothetical protein [bacterium]